MSEATEPHDYELAATLFTEYADALGVDLAFQGFEAELGMLAQTYQQPHGCLLLAKNEVSVVGCGAFRRLQAGICEMKRLYVRPALRGLNAGSVLAQALIVRARAAGHQSMRLDTLATMTSAIRLYRGLGFREIPAYYDTPLEGTLFLELRLQRSFSAQRLF